MFNLLSGCFVLTIESYLSTHNTRRTQELSHFLGEMLFLWVRESGRVQILGNTAGDIFGKIINMYTQDADLMLSLHIQSSIKVLHETSPPLSKMILKIKK